MSRNGLYRASRAFSEILHAEWKVYMKVKVSFPSNDQQTNQQTNQTTTIQKKADHWYFPSHLWPFLHTKRGAGCDVNTTGVVDRAHGNGFPVSWASDLNVVI